MASKVSLRERYQACMILHSVGDAMGYHNNKWEFNFVGKSIHDECKELGGVDQLKLNKSTWRASDDTVLHIAVAECLADNRNVEPSVDLYKKLIDYYKKGMADMKDRAPGNTTIKSVAALSQHRENGHKIPFNSRGGGCGVSMRSPCIGLRYPRRDQLEKLIEFSVESGRMTHHSPVGFLGGTAAALMVSYALQELPIKSWGAKVLVDLELAREYVRRSSDSVRENLEAWSDFVDPWKRYLESRNIVTGVTDPVFPSKYGVEERDKEYKSFTDNKWAGSAGHDSVLIAYDALLGCGGDWRELCHRAMLHGGDNDSTGCLAGAFYGALYGFEGVCSNNYETIEYKKRIEKVADKLYEAQNSEINSPGPRSL